MKEDLKHKIAWYLYLNKDRWFTKAELIDQKKWTYMERGMTKIAMSDTVSRKARLAEEEKLIAQKDDPNSKSILYKWLPPELKDRYIPYSMRTNKEIILRP